jgi:hypothetical protein
MDGGALVAEVLRRQGVQFLFTLCGGHISPILVGAKRRGIRVVDVRDEVNAVFAADAVARLTGRPGVAAVTAGPGITNTITALKNAQLAQSPVLMIGGATPTALKGRGALQDIDQLAAGARRTSSGLLKRCAASRAGARAERGLRAGAVRRAGPVFVECPVDLLYARPRSSRAGTRRRAGPASAPSLGERGAALRTSMSTPGACSPAPSGARRSGPRRRPAAAGADEVRAAAGAARREAPGDGDRQPGDGAARRGAGDRRRGRGARRARVPVGHGPRPARRRPPAADAPRPQRAQARPTWSCCRACPATSASTTASTSRARPPTSPPTAAKRRCSKNRKPQIAVTGDAGRFLQALAQALRALGGVDGPRG